jgi:restriction endonuclease Mrr
MSAFSWGEVGRVTVVDKEPISQVIVLSEKRYKVQVTGTEVDEFAQAIFDGIERALDQ